MSKQYSPCLEDVGFFTRCDPSLCERHHIYMGADRKLSEKYGMKVYLHPRYHTQAPHGVHRNRANDIKLKLYGYHRFKEMYPELEFREIFDTAWFMDLTDEQAQQIEV